MIPTAFEYERATLARRRRGEACRGRRRGQADRGGHSLVPLMKLRLSEPTVLIDIAHIPDFAGIREVDGKIEIGAGTTHHDVATSPLLRDRCPAVAETAAVIGDPQVRNRGTIGGSLAPRRSRRGLSRRHARPRCRSARQGAERLACRRGARLRAGGVHRGSGPGRGARAGDLRAGPGLGVRQAAPAGVALRHRRGWRRRWRWTGGTIASARVGLTGAASSPTRLDSVEDGRSRVSRPPPRRSPPPRASAAPASTTSTATSTPAPSTPPRHDPGLHPARPSPPRRRGPEPDRQAFVRTGGCARPRSRRPLAPTSRSTAAAAQPLAGCAPVQEPGRVYSPARSTVISAPSATRASAEGVAVDRAEDVDGAGGTDLVAAAHGGRSPRRGRERAARRPVRDGPPCRQSACASGASAASTGMAK